MKRFLHHLFLPHESNNHRAKLLHHSSLFFLAGVLLLGSLAFNTLQTTRSDILGISSSINAQELLVLTNLKRQDLGLPLLILDPLLSQAAAGKASDMFAKNYWAHVAPDGTTPWVFIKGAGYEYTYAGENLARGFTTSGDVVNAWMDSLSHRENMLSANYSEIGFAVVSGMLTGEETVLVVEMFGNRNRNVAQEIAVAHASPTPSVNQVLVPSPTQVIKQQIQPPTPTLLPTPTPTPASPTLSFIPSSEQLVAAMRNQPLVNKPALQHNIAFLIVLFIFVTLILDLVVIHKRGVVRLLSHNIDHIIFFAVLLIVIILISKGVIA